MKCGCQVCTTLMEHVEKGEQSYCICPECLNKCRDCLGGKNKRFKFLDRQTAKNMRLHTEKLRDEKYAKQEK